MESRIGKFIPGWILLTGITLFSILSYLASHGCLYQHISLRLGKFLFQSLLGAPGIALALAIKFKGTFLRKTVMVVSGIWLGFCLLGWMAFLLTTGLAAHGLRAG